MISWTKLVIKNARRSPSRMVMTVLAVAISLVAFITVRAVVSGWTEQVEDTPDNRVVTRNKLGWGATLPVHFVEAVREHAGVRRAMGASWGELALPHDRLVEFDSAAIDPAPFVEMHSELEAPEVERQAFVADRRGAMVSLELAREQGWKIGDQLHFKGADFEGEITLTVSSIFRSKRQGFARRTVYFHWAYLNEMLPLADRNRVNMISAEIEDPRQGARMATAIDVMLDRRNGQTISQEDQAVNAQLVGEFGAILEALDFISFMILGIVILVLGNTLSMAIHERSKEYGTLRALGFSREQVMGFILAEGVVLGVLGGGVALLLSLPFVGYAVSRYFEEMLSLPQVSVPVATALITVVIGGALGALGALLPAYRLTSMRTVECLRQMG